MMKEEEGFPVLHVEEQQSEDGNAICCSFLCEPVSWLRMLAREIHWSFVFGVVVVYGISQGFGGAFNRVATEYYMKDVQKVQPSESQFYSGIVKIPWIVKPFWGLLTDVVPILGFHRRPYFIFAAILIRNVLRVTPLALLFLVPIFDPNSSILPDKILGSQDDTENPTNKNLELVGLITKVDES